MMCLWPQLNTSTELQNLTKEFTDLSNSGKMVLFSVNIQVLYLKRIHVSPVATDKIKI
jgi:hypothetical protein